MATDLVLSSSLWQAVVGGAASFSSDSPSSSSPSSSRPLAIAFRSGCRRASAAPRPPRLRWGRPSASSSSADAPVPRTVATDDAYKRPPRTFTSAPGESFVFQFGESVTVEELPAGTRVIYPGVVKDGVRDEDTVRSMVRDALDKPVGSAPLRERLRSLKAAKPNPKVVFAFDDVSVPLPPVTGTDIRTVILEEAESICLQEGVTDLLFICSIALHRFIREDEFKALCGPRLFAKYHSAGRMFNYNAVDEEYSRSIGVTAHGEPVLVCKEFIDADLAVYANVNYVSMDGGFKSYATGMVHYKSLATNHDCKTLRQTRSLYDPANSALHKSLNRIGRLIQSTVDVFHVETVLDENLFPWYLDWLLVPKRQMNVPQRVLMWSTVVSLKLTPLWLRKWIFWSGLVRGRFGLLQVAAGETTQVHAKTLDKIYSTKVVEVDGQCDILILAPTCIGPYTKDMYFNPLLVNTYALGYYYNMYVDGVPLLREGGVVIVVSKMHYQWQSPAHDAYREFFEEVVCLHGGLDEFEAYQDKYANNERLNDIYRKGLGPAAVHGFYMYTWAAHGMDKTGKVFVVGADDPRGPKGLRWEPAPSIMEAVRRAKVFLKKPDASVTYWRSPPVGYARVKTGEETKE